MNKFVEKYGQILLPLITPYDEEENVKYDTYAELIEYLEKNDLCDTFIVTGTTGEACLLRFEERVKLMETAIKTAKTKPVIAGTGCASTFETIALTKEAAKLGYQQVMIVCPFYNKPTQEGIYLHYKAIAEAVPEVNIMLYNIPIFVGVNMEPETVARLAAISNIVGIKDEAGINPTQVSDFILATRDVDPDFAVYNGDDIMLLPTIVQGAMGLVSGGSHIFGHEVRAIFKAFAEGDNEKAKEIFEPIYRVCKSFGQNGRILPNSIIRPAIEKVTGINLGPARLPLAPATEDELAVTFGILKDAGKL